MSIFSVGDITFNNTSRVGVGPDGLLDDTSYNIYKYPIDLGAADKGHYMIIHINGQRETQFDERPGSGIPTVYDPNIHSGNFGIGGGSSPGQLGHIGYIRTIYRTSDTIALYMPDTVNFVQEEGFSELSLTGLIAAGVTAGLSIADTNPSTNAVPPYVENMARHLAGGSDIGRAGFAAVTGKVQNPMLEILYTTPIFRNFRFDFIFYPRSKQESTEVQNIIERLRFHQAPEIYKDSYGYLLIPPSEFDIKFYYNGSENNNIPKISTCVLVALDLDYAPNGFAAYEMPNESKPTLGGTGMPVAIRLGLTFKETEYLTKDSYKQV